MGRCGDANSQNPKTKGAHMRKGIIYLMGAGLILFVGCAEQKPEDAARKFVDQQVKIHHKGFELDTAKVVYKVVEQDGDKAKVEVSGDIAVQAVIPLVMQDGEWVLDMPPGKASAQKAPAMPPGQTPQAQAPKAAPH
jgi:hypothetical protein